MPTLLLVRHGQASFGGANYDELSALGLTQAATLASELSWRGIPIARLTSGSLKRQRQTAEPVAAAFGLPLGQDERWNEYDSAGILSAHSDSSARVDGAAPPITPRAFQAVLEGALDGWMAAGSASAAAESWPAFKARVASALADQFAALGSGETAVVVSSGGAIAAACAVLLGLPEALFPLYNRVVVNASITKLVSGRGGQTLVSFNEHAHLEQGGQSAVTYR